MHVKKLRNLKKAEYRSKTSLLAIMSFCLKPQSSGFDNSYNCNFSPKLSN